MAGNKGRLPTSRTDGLTSNPFASLAGTSEDVPREPEAAERDDEPAPSAAAPTRAVVRYQRKGRGGKEVTVLELRGIPEAELDRWLSQLKREIGCGGFREEEHLVLAGDQRDRLRRVLEDTYN